MNKRPASLFTKDIKYLEQLLEDLKLNFCMAKFVQCQIILKELEKESIKLRNSFSIIKTKEN